MKTSTKKCHSQQWDNNHLRKHSATPNKCQSKTPTLWQRGGQQEHSDDQVQQTALQHLFTKTAQEEHANQQIGNTQSTMSINLWHNFFKSNSSNLSIKATSSKVWQKQSQVHVNQSNISIISTRATLALRKPKKHQQHQRQQLIRGKSKKQWRCRATCLHTRMLLSAQHTHQNHSRYYH